MINRNKAPRLASLALVVALGVSASSAPDRSPHFMGDGVPAINPATCTGELESLRYEIFSKDGTIYTVGAVASGSCVAILDPANGSGIGGLRPGAEFIPCTYDKGNGPERLHAITADQDNRISGVVDVTPNAITEVLADKKVVDCSTIGVVGDVSFVEPR